MYVISSFEHSLFLELAITELEQKGVAKEKILVAPLDKMVRDRKMFDSIHYADGISLFDGAAALGTAFMLLGVIYGFVLKWGPVIWGLIGLFTGAAIGILIDFLVTNKRYRGAKKTSDITTEVVVIVNCENNQAAMIEKVLCNNNALGMTTLSK